MSPQYLSGAQVELERAAGIELRPYQTEARDRVLVLAHRGELLDQAAATLARFGLTVGI